MSDFVGREKELNAFRKALESQPSVVAVTGTLGIGKTRLLQRFEDYAHRQGLDTAWCDYKQRNVVAALRRMSGVLQRKRSRYRKVLRQYDDVQNHISDDSLSNSIKALELNIGPFTIVGDRLPESRLDELREALTSGQNWTNIELFRNPNEPLTKAFLEDLSIQPRNHPVLFFFDDFERTRSSLKDWLFDVIDRCSYLPVTWVIASWMPLKGQPWRRVDRPIQLSLNGLTLEEVAEYLERLSRTAQSRIAKEERQNIVRSLEGMRRVSPWTDVEGHLPLIVEAVVRSQNVWQVLHSAIRDWIEDRTLLEELKIYAVSRISDGTAAECLVDANLIQPDREDIFWDWLRYGDGKPLHDEEKMELVRPLRFVLIQDLYKENPDRCEHTHQALHKCYLRRLGLGSFDTLEVFKACRSEKRWKRFLEAYYHLLSYNPEASLLLGIELALLYIDSPRERGRVYEIADVILQVAKEHLGELTNHIPFSLPLARRDLDGASWSTRTFPVWGEVLETCAEALDVSDSLNAAPDWELVINSLNEFSDLPGLHPLAKIEVYNGIGKSYYELKEFEAAFDHLATSIQIAIDNSIPDRLLEALDWVAEVEKAKGETRLADYWLGIVSELERELSHDEIL